jgi:hypothetical protein
MRGALRDTRPRASELDDLTANLRGILMGTIDPPWPDSRNPTPPNPGQIAVSAEPSPLSTAHSERVAQQSLLKQRVLGTLPGQTQIIPAPDMIYGLDPTFASRLRSKPCWARSGAGQKTIPGAPTTPQPKALLSNSRHLTEATETSALNNSRHFTLTHLALAVRLSGQLAIEMSDGSGRHQVRARSGAELVIGWDAAPGSTARRDASPEVLRQRLAGAWDLAASAQRHDRDRRAGWRGSDGACTGWLPRVALGECRPVQQPDRRRRVAPAADVDARLPAVVIVPRASSLASGVRSRCGLFGPSP